jgi:hypothetical protein
MNLYHHALSARIKHIKFASPAEKQGIIVDLKY